MTDEAKTWRAASLLVPPDTPTAVYVGDSQMVQFSHTGSENVWITVRRRDTHAEAEPVYLSDTQPDEAGLWRASANANHWVRPTEGGTTQTSTRPPELPIDRCIRLMGELEEALGDGLEGPGLLLPDWRNFTRGLAQSRSVLVRAAAAVRGPEPDPEEWVECQWYTRYVDGVCGLFQVCAGDRCGRSPFKADDVRAWNRRKPRGLPRWVYDQLEPKGDS